MAASISFFTGDGNSLNESAGSGLAFFGDSGFGASIRVGDWQGRTYISNGAGSTQGPEAPNVKYLTSGTAVLGQSGSGIALTAIPNAQATLNPRFTYDTPVKVQNTTHQCGTLVFGTDPKTSVLDTFCRTHDVENLFVVDASFFPSSAAVNPALTIIAQALRVADHLVCNELN